MNSNKILKILIILLSNINFVMGDFRIFLARLAIRVGGSSGIAPFFGDRELGAELR